ncbi:hypothetical protein TWF730_003623 [Orbilia blumenaviensis]|uniref:F-box domain-containing protein n=1 Tax=Orbilia blumenaviensis TaxID=1796055 RepID=A0AAV9U5V9_9PEZI
MASTTTTTPATATTTTSIDTFAKIPYLSVFPLETRFPYLSPDDSHKRSRPTTLACTRIAILGSLKASRLQGLHSSSSISPINPSSFSSSLSSSRSRLNSRNDNKQPGHSESAIFNLLTNPITEPILLSYLTTHDLISLRQTSRFLRSNIDRQHRLWRTLNLSHPRCVTPPNTPFTFRSKVVIDPLLYLSKVLNNHSPNTPVSPYYHTRVLILDNYRFKSTHHRIVEELLFGIFTNQCLWNNLRLLSIRGFWDLSIAQITGYLRDWEVGIRGEFRKSHGWRFVNTTNPDTGDEGFQVVDSKGNVIDKEVWSKKRGWTLEVFRFAGPRLLRGGLGFTRPRNHRPIPVPVPSYLSFPCDEEADENGTFRYKTYEETYIPIPFRRLDGSNGAEMLKAMRFAERIGIDIDVGFCRNEEGHAKFKYELGDVSDRWWGICEKRWERCVIGGCKWEGWVEACSHCRWEEGWCCKGCYGWVCEGCRGKNKGDFGEKGRWCGGVAEKCAVVEGAKFSISTKAAMPQNPRHKRASKSRAIASKSKRHSKNSRNTTSTITPTTGAPSTDIDPLTTLLQNSSLNAAADDDDGQELPITMEQIHPSNYDDSSMMDLDPPPTPVLLPIDISTTSRPVFQLPGVSTVAPYSSSLPASSASSTSPFPYPVPRQLHPSQPLAFLLNNIPNPPHLPLSSLRLPQPMFPAEEEVEMAVEPPPSEPRVLVTMVPAPRMDVVVEGMTLRSERQVKEEEDGGLWLPPTEHGWWRRSHPSASHRLGNEEEDEEMGGDVYDVMNDADDEDAGKALDPGR